MAASRTGAKTILVESSRTVGLSRALLPFLLSDGWTEDDLVLPQSRMLAEAGVQVRTGLTVESVQHKDRAIRLSSSSERMAFDSVVLCTGAASQVPQLRGISKPNVFVLRGPADYLRLSESLSSLETFVVSGPIPLGLKLGEILSAKGKRVRVYCGKDGLANQFSEPVAAAIRREASAKGKDRHIALVDGSVDSILGVKAVEAVSSEGAVQTCDGVVVIPRGVPSVPTVECEKGPSGGLLVDSAMSTSLSGVYAAGDSAEIRFKSGSVAARLFSTSRMGGEVAGVNAAGGKASASPSWAVEQTYFGLEFCSAGLTEAEAVAMGLEAATVDGASRVRQGGTWSARETLVSLVYDTGTHQVYGLQVAGWRASALSSAASMIVSLGLTVEQLVHLESPYSPGSSYEVSPIALTAGKVPQSEGS